MSARGSTDRVAAQGGRRPWSDLVREVARTQVPCLLCQAPCDGSGTWLL